MIAVLIGSGPALFESVLRGWDGADFLIVMLGLPALWAVVLMLGDTIVKLAHKKSWQASPVAVMEPRHRVESVARFLLDKKIAL